MKEQRRQRCREGREREGRRRLEGGRSKSGRGRRIGYAGRSWSAGLPVAVGAGELEECEEAAGGGEGSTAASGAWYAAQTGDERTDRRPSSWGTWAARGYGELFCKGKAGR